MFASLLLLLPILVQSQCPFLNISTPSTGTAETPTLEEYNAALNNLSIPAVFNDLYELLTDSQDCWPADEFNGVQSYAGLFIRLAWHCAGTFRDTDGLGGCAGGRQRFEPEASWDDNVNLDKARALLAEIKQKYGDALSWGDLFIFAGTAAILNGGGPVTEVCAGRVDSSNGSLSDPLNDPYGNCTVQGNCSEPFGANTIGLIYVNPQGVTINNSINTNPTDNAAVIREIFGRMGMNDSETVALIGGGHAFGKSHGACLDGPGDAPNVNPDDPWSGNCGTGMGEDTYTSGIEGQWTTFPFQWDNEYFAQLRDYMNGDVNYTLHKGSGDKYQWMNGDNGYLMLTTDIALTADDIYAQIVDTFAEDLEALNIAFSAAWQKLVTSGGVFAENKFCVDSSALLAVSGNGTTTAPSMSPTAEDGMEEKEGMAEKAEMWFIIGVVFIVLFAVAVLIICGLVYRLKKQDNRSGYAKTSGEEPPVMG